MKNKRSESQRINKYINLIVFESTTEYADSAVKLLRSKCLQNNFMIKTINAYDDYVTTSQMNEVKRFDYKVFLLLIDESTIRDWFELQIDCNIIYEIIIFSITHSNEKFNFLCINPLTSRPTIVTHSVEEISHLLNIVH